MINIVLMFPFSIPLYYLYFGLDGIGKMTIGVIIAMHTCMVLERLYKRHKKSSQ